MVLSAATALYIGTSACTKAYIGATQVWPSQSTDYSKMYFTLEALSNGTISLYLSGRNATYQYRINGEEWLNANLVTKTVVNVSKGDKIEYKTTASFGDGTAHSGIWSGSTAALKMYGNIMSLKYGDNFSGETLYNIPNWGFQRIFGKMTTLTDASNLYIPANTKFGSYACEYLFAEDTALVTPPKVLTQDDMILSTRTFDYAFSGCTSMTTAPELLKTVITNNAYRYLFDGCTSLKHIKCLIWAPNTSYQMGWVRNVPPGGIFEADYLAEWSTGINGIPEGWTRIDIGDE